METQKADLVVGPGPLLLALFDLVELGSIDSGWFRANIS